MEENFKSPQTLIGVGIDTARYGHYVTFLREDLQPAAKPLEMAEKVDGYERLRETLVRLFLANPDVQFHVRIDAAGQYATNLEHFLRRLSLPIVLSVGQPAQNKSYREVHFPKNKSDAAESFVCARFAIVERPKGTSDVSDQIYVLREIAGQLESQTRRSTRLNNQLHNRLARVFPELALLVHLRTEYVLGLLIKYSTPEKIARAQLRTLTAIRYLSCEKAQLIQKAAKQTVGSLRGPEAEQLIRELATQLLQSLATEKRLEKLLVKAFTKVASPATRQISTIKGIGDVTAAVLVAKMVSIDRFHTPSDVIGYFGIFPELNSSGVDRYGNPKPSRKKCMSRKGNDLVRKYLWNCAKVASRHNPAVRALYQRLRAHGTRGDVALGHCMRKLLHQVFFVWKTGKPFDPEAYPHEKAQQQAQAARKAKQQENAAGHNKDASPNRQVVTAATPRLSGAETPVKDATHPRSSAPKDNRSVDFAALRSQVTMQQVLCHLRLLDRLRGSGPQRRGPCPIHGSQGSRSRTFSVNLQKSVFQCFHPPCNAKGNVLDFWAAVHDLPLHSAALDLAQTLKLEPFLATANREEEPVSGTRESP
jgi:transposase